MILSTVFLCSEFKLENIYSGVIFCGKNVGDNFYLPELIFADRWKNRKNRKLKIRTRKNFVPHGTFAVYLNCVRRFQLLFVFPPMLTALGPFFLYIYTMVGNFL